MGEFNRSCAISDLPIGPNTDIVVAYLTPNLEDWGASQFFDMPFYAKSDYYGGWHSPTGWGYKSYLDNVPEADLMDGRNLKLGGEKLHPCYIRRDVWDHLTSTPFRDELKRDYLKSTPSSLSLHAFIGL